jgi:hypothetical protein
MSFPETQKTAVAMARASMPNHPLCLMAKGMDKRPMPMNIFICRAAEGFGFNFVKALSKRRFCRRLCKIQSCKKWEGIPH